MMPKAASVHELYLAEIPGFCIGSFIRITEADDDTELVAFAEVQHVQIGLCLRQCVKGHHRAGHNDRTEAERQRRKADIFSEQAHIDECHSRRVVRTCHSNCCSSVAESVTEFGVIAVSAERAGTIHYLGGAVEKFRLVNDTHFPILAVHGVGSVHTAFSNFLKDFAGHCLVGIVTDRTACHDVFYYGIVHG